MYLVDTDWIILHFRRNDQVARRIEELIPEGIGLSVVSMGELYEGVYKASDPTRSEEALRLFLEAVDVVPLDDAACRAFGEERARLREEGNLIGDMDILIGATAISNNLALLTNNTRHFERMQGLKLY